VSGAEDKASADAAWAAYGETLELTEEELRGAEEDDDDLLVHIEQMYAAAVDQLGRAEITAQALADRPGSEPDAFAATMTAAIAKWRSYFEAYVQVPGGGPASPRIVQAASAKLRELDTRLQRITGGTAAPAPAPAPTPTAGDRAALSDQDLAREIQARQLEHTKRIKRIRDEFAAKRAALRASKKR
jgi:hypothetical protein